VTRTLLPWLAAAAVGLGVCADAGAAGTGRTYRDTFHGVGYLVYEPAIYRKATGKDLGLVMGLHGCGGDADFFLKQTRLIEKADADARAGRPYVVVLPEKKGNLGCWNFTSSNDATRDPGYPAVLADPEAKLNEPTVLAGITRQLLKRYKNDSYPKDLNPRRVYAMGFSAGAAMSVILGVTYPDVFAAIGSHSGCEYLCGFFQVDPQRAGDAAFDAMPAGQRRVVPFIAIVGSADRMAPQKNTDNAITAWAQTDDRTSDGADDDNITDVLPLPPRNSSEDGVAPVYRGRDYVHTTYRDERSGKVILEKVVVDGMVHAWSGGPDGMCYSDPRGPDATALIMDFLTARTR
jgi:poly(3-hydroxybutyrate) depolymerase